MRSFKEQINESALAAMPKALLHAKTMSVLGDHGYQEHTEGSNSTSYAANEQRRVMHHKIDNDHAEELDNDPHGHDNGAQTGDDYIEDGPHSTEIHHGLHDLGWRHEPRHGMYHSLGDGNVIKTDVYSHPSGASMTHMAHHVDGESNHYWHLR